MKLTIRTNPEIVIEIDDGKSRDSQPVADKDKFLKTLHRAIDTPPMKSTKGKRHCRKCGDAGHRSDSCPQDGRGTIKDKIRALADEGLTSEEISDKLGISLAAVNKYW